MRTLLPLILAAVCLLAAPKAPGAEVQGLFEAEVPVPSKSEAHRAAALGIALVQVARKVSGARSPESNRVIAAARQKASRYVQQFRYRTLALATGSGSDARADEALLLWAQFDPKVTAELLREAGLPVWGRIRPSVVLWLAVERQGRRSLVGADDGSGLTGLVRSTAEQWGLPLLLPLLDLDDQSRIETTDVWGGFRETLLRASERYQSEAVLVGRAYQVLPALWEVRWRLFLDDATEEWMTRGEPVELAVEEGIQRATEVLARRFATTEWSVSPGAIEMVVTGIRSLDDYARTLTYLQSLGPVTRVSLKRADDVAFMFRLTVRGGPEAVVQVVGLGRTLEPAGVGDELRYRLVP